MFQISLAWTWASLSGRAVAQSYIATQPSPFSRLSPVANVFPSGEKTASKMFLFLFSFCRFVFKHYQDRFDLITEMWNYKKIIYGSESDQRLQQIRSISGLSLKNLFLTPINGSMATTKPLFSRLFTSNKIVLVLYLQTVADLEGFLVGDTIL